MSANWDTVLRLRAKSSSLWVMSEQRPTWPSMTSRLSRMSRRASGDWGESRLTRISSASCMMMFRGLLISWAMPVVISPRARVFWDWMSWLPISACSAEASLSQRAARRSTHHMIPARTRAAATTAASPVRARSQAMAAMTRQDAG